MEKRFDLIVIGSGLAGTAAACFGARRGLRVARVSATDGEVALASGLLDLLGVYPAAEQTLWDRPWEGLARLVVESPDHPYARVGMEGIRKAMEEFLAVLDGAGLPYCGWPDRNALVATAAGTLKSTYRVPRSMWGGALAFQERLPTLIVDFVGMKDFRSRLMVETLRPLWPDLKARRIPFPLKFLGDDRQNPLLAEAMESPDVLRDLGEALRPHLAGIRMVGLPAVLGLRSTNRILTDLEDQIGVGVFEIPTLPPSVPGLRLREALDSALEDGGASLLPGRRILACETHGRRVTTVTVGTEQWRETLETRGVILATGRFLGGGLAADRNGIKETVLGLPVVQPPNREDWHRERFLDHRGHPVNQAGLEVDHGFRPLGTAGGCAFENVFAAGSILAHQDWVRTKSGAGLAVATAFGAVESFLERTCR